MRVCVSVICLCIPPVVGVAGNESFLFLELEIT